jgi:hypothetical protein
VGGSSCTYAGVSHHAHSRVYSVWGVLCVCVHTCVCVCCHCACVLHWVCVSLTAAAVAAAASSCRLCQHQELFVGRRVAVAAVAVGAFEAAAVVLVVGLCDASGPSMCAIGGGCGPAKKSYVFVE